MNFQDLNILIKYCSNRVNYDLFLEMMLEIYNDENYISKLWTQFRDNPMMFIVSRNETGLFDLIQERIKSTNYKG